MQKNLKLIIFGVILVSFLLISSSTLVKNVQGQSLINQINGIGKNNNLSPLINDFLKKLKNRDENFLKKQALKMISILETRIFKNVLNRLNLVENLDEKLESLKDVLLNPNNYKNYNKENSKNTVTVRTSTLNGVEEINKEMSSEEVKKLLYKLKEMKEALRTIDSSTATNNEKKEAHKLIDNVYNHLKNLELLPADLKKQEAIDLITGQYGKQIYENLGWSKFFELMKNERKKGSLDEDIDNSYCVVSCEGYAHITYLAIDLWLILLGSIPRLIFTAPVSILILVMIPVIFILLILYGILKILEILGYPVEEYIKLIENIFEMFISTLGIVLWALEPGFKLMYKHHKLLPERNIVGYAIMNNGNLSVDTVGLLGSKSGIVTDLEIIGFIGLWIESEIEEPEFPDYGFTSTISCNGCALAVSKLPIGP